LKRNTGFNGPPARSLSTALRAPTAKGSVDCEGVGRGCDCDRAGHRDPFRARIRVVGRLGRAFPVQGSSYAGPKRKAKEKWLTMPLQADNWRLALFWSAPAMRVSVLRCLM
jgi:hypothetical protein